MEQENFKTVATLVKNTICLDCLVHLIIDNAELGYSGQELRISNETTILQYIKYLYPEIHENKIKELKERGKNGFN